MRKNSLSFSYTMMDPSLTFTTQERDLRALKWSPASYSAARQEANMPVVQKGTKSKTGSTQSNHFGFKTEISSSVHHLSCYWSTTSDCPTLWPRLLHFTWCILQTGTNQKCYRIKHINPTCVWLPQAKLQRLAKCSRCCMHFRRQLSLFLVFFPRHKHPINIVKDQGVYQPKQSEFYMHPEGLLLNPVFPNVHHLESHLAVRRAHVLATKEVQIA